MTPEEAAKMLGDMAIASRCAAPSVAVAYDLAADALRTVARLGECPLDALLQIVSEAATLKSVTHSDGSSGDAFPMFAARVLEMLPTEAAAKGARDG